MKIVSLFSVRGYNIPLFWRSTSQFYFGTGEGSIEHFTRFRPFTRFRFLFIDCFRLHHQ
jgi:hypothetical protein